MYSSSNNNLHSFVSYCDDKNKNPSSETLSEVGPNDRNSFVKIMDNGVRIKSWMIGVHVKYSLFMLGFFLDVPNID